MRRYGDEGLRNEMRDEKANAPANYKQHRDCYDGLPHHFVDAVPGGLCDGCRHEASAGAVACADCGRCECAPCHERPNHRS